MPYQRAVLIIKNLTADTDLYDPWSSQFYHLHQFYHHFFSKLYTRNKREFWTSCFVAVGIVSLFENCKTYIFGQYSSHSGLKRASKGRLGINSRTDSWNIQNLSSNLTQYAAVCKGRPFGWRKAEAGGRKGEHLRSAGQVPAIITQMSDVIKGRPCALKLCVPSAVTFIVQLSTS